MSTTDEEQNMHVQCDRTIVRLGEENESLRRAIAAAIDELGRWQYDDDPTNVQHSIDMAIAALRRG